VAAFHYLLKPIEEDKFREVFRRAERELEKRKKKQRDFTIYFQNLSIWDIIISRHISLCAGKTRRMDMR